MYEKFEQLMNIKGVKPFHVSKDTGISTATLTEWKKGRYTPKLEKLKIIADYFGVSVSYFTDDNTPEPEENDNVVFAYHQKKGKTLTEEQQKKVDEYIDFILSQDEKE